ncbi:MAG: CidA/LrgA family protein [Roseburia sp.]
MKYIRQFCVILAVSFLGEVLKTILPFPIPASIYGLVLMFLALEFKIIKLEQVKETGKYLIEIMPLMFIPAGVGLLEAWGDLKPICVQVVVIMVVSTIVVMGISGRVTQWVIRSERKRKG